ncbi:MAG TPA: PAS and ANTAR domain-containing protein [Nocardioidaceae bacterium]|nr:PAS and ANTAR domain-containing protein [Nocardioidaceae bacterium]
MTTVITGPYGPFRYNVATQQWWWSDDLYRIHGFEPGDVVPTTDLLFRHKHPDDAAVATAIILNAFTSGEPFALWHRIIDARLRTRTVVSVGDGFRDEAGELVEVRGFMVDVTGSKRSQTARDIDEAVRRSAESRGAIEQAKGIIMATLAVDADEAFAMLKKSSQNANIKLRDLASTLLGTFEQMRVSGLDARKAVDEVLGDLTADR